MAMLERVVKPNAQDSTATTVGGKRKVRGAGNGGGGGVADIDARNLLHKLERKVRDEERKGARRMPRGYLLSHAIEQYAALYLPGSGSLFEGAWIVHAPGRNGCDGRRRRAWIGSFNARNMVD